MPFDAKRYPKDWKNIAARIRDRDGNRCKFCGVFNGAVGYRLPDGSFVQLAESVVDRRKIITIVLTVAHLGAEKPDGSPGDKHDKMDCRNENLAALCQRCHLRLDVDEHAANASRTRALKSARGMESLF